MIAEPGQFLWPREGIMFFTSRDYFILSPILQLHQLIISVYLSVCRKAANRLRNAMSFQLQLKYLVLNIRFWYSKVSQLLFTPQLFFQINYIWFALCIKSCYNFSEYLEPMWLNALKYYQDHEHTFTVFLTTLIKKMLWPPTVSSESALVAC